MTVGKFFNSILFVKSFIFLVNVVVMTASGPDKKLHCTDDSGVSKT